MSNKAKDHKNQVIAEIRETFTAMIEDYEASKAEFAKKIAENPTYTLEIYTTKMIEAQRKMQMARHTLNVIDIAFDPDHDLHSRTMTGVIEPDMSDLEKALAALEMVRNEYVNEVLIGNFYARSTNPVANHIEVVKAKTTADFVGNFGKLHFLIGQATYHLSKAQEAA